MVTLYLYSQVEVRTDPRPSGERDDIAKLSERDDLNVVFILIDTLRADRLGHAGYERDTSPGLDYMAETGIRFANHWAQSSWTKASMASMWTGLYPNHTGVIRAQDALSNDARVPAEVFQEAGFVTAGIWRNGWVAPNFGMQQGFDVYQLPNMRQGPETLRRATRAGRIEGSDIDLVYAATDFLQTHNDQRFFLYLHFMDVHQYVSTDETAIFGTRYSDSYDNSILWTDHQVRAILGALDSLGLRDETLVVVASDHGEAFGEHGAEGHARNLHAEVTRTPFIVSLPFILDEGVVIESRSANVDLWPTILELVGLPPLAAADGRSRVPEIMGDETAVEEEPPIYAHLDRTWGVLSKEPAPLVAVSEGPYRLLRDVSEPRKDRLYDISADPAEKRNLSEEPDGVRASLTERTSEYLDAGVAWREGAPRVELDDMSLRQLRALGYAVE